MGQTRAKTVFWICAKIVLLCSALLGIEWLVCTFHS